MNLYRQLIIDGLVELSDRSYQERVWTGHDPNAMSSFGECVEAIFDDSGLAVELQRGEVFGDPADQMLVTLDSLVALVDQSRSIEELLLDDMVAKCRQLAAEVLTLLSTVDGRE